MNTSNNTSTSNTSHNGSLNSNDGQSASRLQQWKKLNQKNPSIDDNTSSSLGSLLSIQPTSCGSNGFFDDKGIGNDWKTGALDWSPPNTFCGVNSSGGGSSDCNNSLDINGFEIIPNTNINDGFHLKKSGLKLFNCFYLKFNTVNLI